MDNATTLSLARSAVGAAAWAAPEFSLKAGMLDPAAPESPYLLRLFGARDAALGLVTLLAAPEHKASLLMVGVGVDAADTAAAVRALQHRRLGTATGVTLAAAAAAALLTGAGALAQHRRR